MKEIIDIRSQITKKILVLDGGMGTLIQKYDLQANFPIHRDKVCYI